MTEGPHNTLSTVLDEGDMNGDAAAQEQPVESPRLHAQLQGRSANLICTMELMVYA
jgi:hypothetical protein